MFAPRPEKATAELFRVARHGAIVGMANYSDSGFLGAFGNLLSRYSKPAPTELPSLFAWGEEATVRRRFDRLASSIEIRSGLVTLRFASLDEGVLFWERTNPPLIALHAMLPPERYVQFMKETRELMVKLNASTDDGLLLESGYLSVVARK